VIAAVTVIVLYIIFTAIYLPKSTSTSTDVDYNEHNILNSFSSVDTSFISGVTLKAIGILPPAFINSYIFNHPPPINTTNRVIASAIIPTSVAADSWIYYSFFLPAGSIITANWTFDSNSIYVYLIRSQNSYNYWVKNGEFQNRIFDLYGNGNLNYITTISDEYFIVFDSPSYTNFFGTFGYTTNKTTFVLTNATSTCQFDAISSCYFGFPFSSSRTLIIASPNGPATDYFTVIWSTSARYSFSIGLFLPLGVVLCIIAALIIFYVYTKD